MTWDIFLSYPSAELPQARELQELLTHNHQLQAFLSRTDLVPGDLWEPQLKRALSETSVIAVLVTPATPEAYYQQAEVEFAIDLTRERTQAHRVVPVLLKGASAADLHLGLRPLHAIQEDASGLPGVARELAAIIPSVPHRRTNAALAGASELTDELWVRLGPAYADRVPAVPEEFRLRYAADGNDIVARDRDHERQRLNGADLERNLRPDQLDYLEVLERSMWINRWVWDRAYPQRVVDPSERQRADAALDAMGEDLGHVIDLLGDAGLFLDDHYLMVRDVIAQHGSHVDSA